MRKINLLVIPFLAIVIISCSNPMDNKISTTNYKTVVQEIERKNILSKQACESLINEIERMLALKMLGGDFYVHQQYGSDYDNITYRDVHNYIVTKKGTE